MKKILAFICVCTLLTSLLSFGVSAQENGDFSQIPIEENAKTVTVGEITYNVIRTTEEFLSMSSEDGSAFILANDLNFGLSGTLAPNGTGDVPANGYENSLLSGLKGTYRFNGNGYSLKNINLDISGRAESVFSYPKGATVVIENLTIELASAKIGKRSGVIFGESKDMNEATISNVDIKALNGVAVTTGIDGECAGIFVAYSAKTPLTFNDCHFNGNIAVSQIQTACFLGLHYSGNVTLNDCSYNSDIAISAANQKDRIGGFIGVVNGAGKVMLDGCIAKGTLGEAKADSSKKAAGFIGTVNHASATVEFKDCINETSISSSANAAGFVGYMSKGTLCFENCENKGTVSSSGAYSAGFISQIAEDTAVQSLSFIGCTNSGTVNGTAENGGFLGKSAKNYDLKFVDCTNSGEVKNTDASATGVTCGFIGNTVDGYNSLSYNRCISMGALTGAATVAFSQSSANASMQLKNCYELEGIATASTAEAKTFKSGELAEVLQTLEAERKNESENAHEHNYSGECAPSGIANHTIACTVCGELYTEAHSFSGLKDCKNGTHAKTCSKCGYVNEISAQEHACDYTDNKDGTHTAVCVGCDYTATEECSFTDKDGKSACELCGSEAQTSDTEAATDVQEQKKGCKSVVSKAPMTAIVLIGSGMLSFKKNKREN